jgi:SPP1 gp7 family putative phage head morphogenesis protein
MANTKLPPKEYWIKRSEQNFLLQEKKAEEYISSLLKSYNKVKDNIDKEISVFYMRYAVNNSINYIDAQRLLNKPEIDNLHDRLDTYIKEAKLYSNDPLYIQKLENMSIRTRIRRIEALKFDIQHQIEILEAMSDIDIDKLLTDIYTDNYYRSIYDIQTGLEFGTVINIINTKAVEKIVRTKWLGENYSDRIYSDKAKLLRTIEVELSQSFIRGDSIQNTSKRVSKRLEVSYNTAVRLIRTESNHISNEAFADSLINSGVVSEYEYLATLDNRTSDLCRPMDSKHFKWSEKEVGVNFPPLHSNCRSTIIPYFEDEDTPERIAKEANGKTFYVDGKMSYKDWKAKYID